MSCIMCDVEVSSDAAAAIKQNSGGFQQTFISSESKAKTSKDIELERGLDGWVGQRSDREIPIEEGETIIGSEILHKLSWGYKDSDKTYEPEKWYKYYPTCAGYRQSPIALQAEPGKEPSKLLASLKMNTYDKDGLLYGNLVNNGNSFGMQIDEQKSVINITGGPLENQIYLLNQFHFHYSCDNRFTGSEHSIDGLKYSAEVHFFFYNTKYDNFTVAMDKYNGLCVLAFFIKPSIIVNHGTFMMNRYLIDINDPKSSVTVGLGISIFDLITKIKDGIENMNYVYYSGSLTTPPCYESVTWIVFQDPIKVNLKDIFSWRKLNGDSGKLCDNFRPLQQINDRNIFFVNLTKT